jgi:hypothetical protein
VATHAASGAEGIDVARVELPVRPGAEPWAPGFTPVEPLRPDVDGILNLGGAVVLSDGTLVVSFFSMAPPRGLWSARRNPATGAWETTRIRESILPVGFPSLAVARSGPFAGRVYAAWVESPEPADLRVRVAASDDAGATWTDPVRVHTDTSRVGRTLPVVAVAPDGAVGVVWQDQRSAGGRVCYDLYGAISTDGGTSFLPETRLSSETACAGSHERNGAAAARFRLGGGDYQGLVAIGASAFRAIWADARTGRYQLWSAPLRAQR